MSNDLSLFHYRWACGTYSSEWWSATEPFEWKFKVNNFCGISVSVIANWHSKIRLGVECHNLVPEEVHKDMVATLLEGGTFELLPLLQTSVSSLLSVMRTLLQLWTTLWRSKTSTSIKEASVCSTCRDYVEKCFLIASTMTLSVTHNYAILAFQFCSDSRKKKATLSVVVNRTTAWMFTVKAFVFLSFFLSF